MSYTSTYGDWYVDLALGKSAGNIRTRTTFGENYTVTGGVFEPVWSYSGAITFPTAAQTLDIASSVTTDASGQAGALTMVIEGLDANFNEQSETVTLNGTNTVTTSGSYVRVNRAYCDTVATYSGKNLGNITIQQTTSGYVVGYIEAAKGQAAQCIYTVPAGWQYVILEWQVTSATNQTTDFELLFRPNADDVTTPFAGTRAVYHQNGVSGTAGIHLADSPLVIPEKSDIWAIASQATSTAQVTSSLHGILIRNRD